MAAVAPAAGGASVDAEEDDVVVRELPVFLATQLASELHVLQFPLRPASRPYDADHGNAPTAAAFKPKVQRLELEVPISLGANHDSGVARILGAYYQPIAPTSDGRAADAGHGQGQGAPTEMRTQRLTSTVVPSKTHYVIGVCKDDQLHLTPARAVLQMRPSLAYLDEQDAKEKEASRPTEDEEDDETGEDEVKAVQVQFKRRESERAQAARKRSHAYLQKQFDDEAWVAMTYHDDRSAEAEGLYDKLFAEDDRSIVLPTTKAEYINALIPLPVAVGEHRQTSAVAGVVSMHDLKTKDLNDRVRTLLQSAQMITFQRLRDVVLLQDDVKDLLVTVQKYAYLVQGNWTVKSELFLDQRMAQCRDYLLYLFSKDRVISRREFTDMTDLPSDTVRELLVSLARLRPNLGWELKLPTDDEFIARNPELVQRQRAVFEQRYAVAQAARTDRAPPRIAKGLNFKSARATAATPAAASSAAAVATTDGVASRTATAEAMEEDADRDEIAPEPPAGPRPILPTGETPAAQLDHYVLALLRQYGLCTLPFLAARVKERALVPDLPHNLLADDAVPTAAQVEGSVVRVGQLFTADAYVPSTVEGAPQQKAGGAAQHWAALLPLLEERRPIKKTELTAAVKSAMKKGEYSAAVASTLIDLLFTSKRGAPLVMRAPNGGVSG